jgi:hypothetical protein
MGAPFQGAPVFQFKGRRKQGGKGQRERISEQGGPYWLARFRRIVALASDRYISQLRRDCRAISSLIASAERVDWSKVPAFTAVDAKPEPPSWAARKARRVRPKPPPDFIKWSIEAWRHSYDFRTIIFCGLLIGRRLCSHASMPQLPAVILRIARQWLEGLPQHQPPQSVKPNDGPHAR